MDNTLAELVEWCRQLREKETASHRKTISQGLGGDMTDVRHEMYGMWWTLDIVVEELTRRIEERKNG